MAEMDARARSMSDLVEKSAFVADDSCYKPKNIMVTGGAGFIASHVCILLAKKYPQFKIVNFDRLDYCSCLANLDEIKDYPNYKFVQGNICS
eukprot:CAMPEP_0181313146 /NCGR_PEP_ID=MMETSP1101-20121128/14092_1 /TAXON_ID=46948 /ORGANISM="Rhodomonas abbreviata, Strain Caron Lab Isolate" /LENGTH=91 /DNA_ID=CAMNT_0023420079 /DNA_START=21 /DNA_END=293 /DNA_ORIENTATION=-